MGGGWGNWVFSFLKDKLIPLKLIASKSCVLLIKIHVVSVDVYHWNEIRKLPDNYCLVKSVETDLLKGQINNLSIHVTSSKTSSSLL